VSIGFFFFFAFKISAARFGDSWEVERQRLEWNLGLPRGGR